MGRIQIACLVGFAVSCVATPDYEYDFHDVLESDTPDTPDPTSPSLTQCFSDSVDPAGAFLADPFAWELGPSLESSALLSPTRERSNRGTPSTIAVLFGNDCDSSTLNKFVDAATYFKLRNVANISFIHIPPSENDDVVHEGCFGKLLQSQWNRDADVFIRRLGYTRDFVVFVLNNSIAPVSLPLDGGGNTVFKALHARRVEEDMLASQKYAHDAATFIVNHSPDLGSRFSALVSVLAVIVQVGILVSKYGHRQASHTSVWSPLQSRFPLTAAMFLGMAVLHFYPDAEDRASLQTALALPCFAVSDVASSDLLTASASFARSFGHVLLHANE